MHFQAIVDGTAGQLDDDLSHILVWSSLRAKREQGLSLPSGGLRGSGVTLSFSRERLLLSSNQALVNGKLLQPSMAYYGMSLPKFVSLLHWVITHEGFVWHLVTPKSFHEPVFSFCGVHTQNGPRKMNNFISLRCI
eukprot:1270560-Pleurochrysis_carterae.AAC.4